MCALWWLESENKDAEIQQGRTFRLNLVEDFDDITLRLDWQVSTHSKTVYLTTYHDRFFMHSGIQEAYINTVCIILHGFIPNLSKSAADSRPFLAAHLFVENIRTRQMKKKTDHPQNQSRR